MTTIRSLLSQREARLALAVWTVIPTLFLLFALTLAVDPSTQLSKVHLGVAALDAGAQTPQGPIMLAARISEGLTGQLPFQVAAYPSEAALRDAVLAREVAAGVVFPEDFSAKVLARQAVGLKTITSNANDAFTNQVTSMLSSQIATNLNAALPQLLAGPNAAALTPPLVSVSSDVVAVAKDFRLALVPAVLVLPIWIATLAFSVLLARAGAEMRKLGSGAVSVGLAELVVSLVAAAAVSAVLALDVALFAWRWDLDFLVLGLVFWAGLAASAWVVQGAIRLFGLELGALLTVVGLFVQQSVSGAQLPASFAPDWIAWMSGFSPLRFLVEGLRNALIGGTTTPQMVTSLLLIALGGLLLFALGVGRLTLGPSSPRAAAPHAV